MTQPDLLLIGSGHLGRRVGATWRDQTDAPILAETLTERAWDDLRALGFSPRRRAWEPPQPHPFVLFAIPPSGAEDYAAEARRAASLWDGSGSLVMTSSTGVYPVTDGERCVEGSPVAEHDRARRLLDAEAEIRAVGGVIVRLAGLYDVAQGPHRVYMRNATSARHPEGLINLIHYDDAARLIVAALHHGARGAVYMGCDDRPISRQRLVEAALRSPRYRDLDATRCEFTGESGALGRICDNTATRQALGWSPTWATFEAWAADEAQEA